MRYSFSPITNNNWNQATPAHIVADSRYGIDDRSDGKFAKWWPYYQAVWAPFRLASSADEAKLTAGVKVYFAIKDISQVNGNGASPVLDCGVGNWGTCGRDYASHGDTFDFAGDKPVLNLIKRIDFIIPGAEASGQVVGNQTPIAVAGDDQVITLPSGVSSESVTLDGSASYDIDSGDTLSYQWYEGTQLLSSSSQAVVSLAEGDHTITLTVTDSQGATANDALTVSVINAQTDQGSTSQDRHIPRWHIPGQHIHNESERLDNFG